MEDFKTVAIFTFASEYTVLQHLLEQAEIRFFFQNERMISEMNKQKYYNNKLRL